MFDVSHWFWLADDGRLYSSRARGLVSAIAADFVAWSAWFAATPWPRDEAGEQTIAALDEALAPHGFASGLA